MSVDDTAEDGRDVAGGTFASRFGKKREDGSEHRRHQNYQARQDVLLPPSYLCNAENLNLRWASLLLIQRTARACDALRPSQMDINRNSARTLVDAQTMAIPERVWYIRTGNPKAGLKHAGMAYQI